MPIGTVDFGIAAKGDARRLTFAKLSQVMGTRFAIMNDRLLNNPAPPREVNPEITPELQEIIYRAMERDPKNRYATAKEFARDLAHPEQVGVEDREELHNWKERRSPLLRKILFYIGLALIPVVISGLMLWVAKHA